MKDKIKLDASNGFHVYGWMITDLHLEGGDLFAFAIVHQFAQSRAGVYMGNTSYLSAWTGWTEKTSRSHLANLVNLGLIREIKGRENNVPFCHYELAPDFYEKHPVKITASPGKNFPEQTEKITATAGKKLPGDYNSNIDYKNIDLNTNPPSPLEVVAYCREIGFRDPAGFTLYYLEEQKRQQWKKKNGEPIVNWKNNVRVWWKYHKDEIFPRPASMAPRVNENTLISYLKNEKAGTTNAGI